MSNIGGLNFIRSLTMYACIFIYILNFMNSLFVSFFYFLINLLFICFSPFVFP